jgi:hypothetical protein
MSTTTPRGEEGEIVALHKCYTCKGMFPKTAFNKEARQKYGIQKHCRKCANERVRKWREDNREKFNENHNRSRKANAEKYKARYALNSAVLKGELLKLPCVVCGNEDVEAHHEDYSKPLEVMWLCKTHHTAIHSGRLPNLVNV